MPARSPVLAPCLPVFLCLPHACPFSCACSMPARSPVLTHRFPVLAPCLPVLLCSLPVFLCLLHACPFSCAHSVMRPACNYSYYSFCRTKTGYSGTATYCRQGSGWTPCAAEDGVNGTWTADKIGHYVAPADGPLLAPCECNCSTHSRPLKKRPSPVYEDAAELKALDSEGRCVVTDHGAFVLFNCYCPNSGGGNEDRVNFKMRFNRLLQTRVDRTSRRHRLARAHPRPTAREPDSATGPVVFVVRAEQGCWQLGGTWLWWGTSTCATRRWTRAIHSGSCA